MEESVTIHVRGFSLPESSFLSEETRAALKRARVSTGWADAVKDCPSMEGAALADVPKIRQCQAHAWYKTDGYKRVLDRYEVVISSNVIGGVEVETFRPADGVTKRNEDRVLINVHGGGFFLGSGTNSRLESIPIAAVGKITVISIDYRMAPQWTFPAASEDVVAVYRELLKTYKPADIGIYGCSAGGVLTAQATACFQRQQLPRPGAIGMFCGGASYWSEGDSGHFASALTGLAFDALRENPYFKNVDVDDPLAFPIRSPEMMAKFPPSLLIASTRDIALSSVAQTHSALIAQGVSAELHVWDGLGHAFIYNPDLPQSRKAYEVIVEFFGRRLGHMSP